MKTKNHKPVNSKLTKSVDKTGSPSGEMKTNNKIKKEVKLCQIVNVGIRADQKKQIIKRLKYGESINKFVQDAVDKKLKRK